MTRYRRSSTTSDVERTRNASAMLEDRVADLERAAGIHPRWVDLTYTSPWTDYGSGFQTGQVRRSGDIVSLRGLIKASSDPGDIPTMFVLDEGYRPPARILKAVACAASPAPGIGQVMARCDIYDDGTVSVFQPDTGSLWYGYVSLDTIPPFSVSS